MKATIKQLMIWIPVIFLGATLVLTSCSKGFLDKQPLGALSPDLLASKSVLDALLTGTYAALDGQGSGNTAIATGNPWEATPTNWIYGSVAGGDSHKGSSLGDQPSIVPIATGNSDPSNGFFNTKWKALYEGVSRANAVITTVPQTANLTSTDTAHYMGEARFLRGHFYFELKKFWNMVPWIDEKTTDYNQPNDKDIWPNIEADFQYAVDNLPATQSQVGRANKWAAMSYLAKVLLYEKKYAAAKTLFDQVVASGVTSGGKKYNLTERFEDNFDAATKNNEESVFAIQMTANDGTNSIANANGGEMLNYPYNSPFRCCGFYQPSVDLANSYRTTAGGLPYLDDYNSHAVKHDLGIITATDPGGQAFTPDAGNLDPRIDWTIGRRGIPFHDWGLHPGSHWVRDQASAGPYSNKKNIYWQYNASTFSDQSTWAPGSAINVNVIRFADVLLMAAECDAQLGLLGDAEDLVNKVRNRMVPSVTSKGTDNWLFTYSNNSNPTGGFSSTPAANYVVSPYATGAFASGGQAYALKAIYFERKLELACEGNRYFDLARWGTLETTLNAYFAYEGAITNDLPSAHVTETKNQYYPIPQTQIDLEGKKDGKNNLQQNPGYSQ